jgi:hypothetical protein
MAFARPPTTRPIRTRPTTTPSSSSTLCDAADGDEILVSHLVRALSTSPARYVNERALVLEGMNQPTIAWTVDWSASCA